MKRYCGILLNAALLVLAGWLPRSAAAECLVEPCSISINTATGRNPPPQPLAINVVITGKEVVTYTAKVTLQNSSSGIQWLSVDPPTGYLGGPMKMPTVRPNAVFNAAALAPGTYSANIFIQVQGAGNPSLDIPVRLVVGGAASGGASITLTPDFVSLTALAGGAPSAQTVLLNTGIPSGFSAFASSTGWLSVSPTSGNTNPGATLTVIANPTNLAAGTYSGKITASAGSASQSLSVNFRVDRPPVVTLTVDPSWLSFNLQQGGANPATQTVQISSSAAVAGLNVAVSAPWLKAASSAASAPATLAVSADPSGMGPGTYFGTVTISAANATAQSVGVTLVVAPAAPFITGVTNAASDLPTPLAPGLLLRIRGRGIGPDEPILARAESGAMPTALAGVRVLMNGKPASVLSAQSDQVGAVAPYDIVSAPMVSLEVEYMGVRSNSLLVLVAPSAPGLFKVLNQDLSANNPANPAEQESVVVLYLTGDGAQDPAASDGVLTPSEPASKPVLPVSVEVAGAPVPPENIQYAGAAASSIGIMRIDVKLPPGISGDTPIRVGVGDAFSQDGVMVSVKSAVPTP